MRACRAGWSLAAALSLLAAPAAGGILRVDASGGTLLEIEVADTAGWCLRWNHSVTGGAVADCFRNEGGRMVLDRSYLHDFAAGLGEMPGRGRLIPAEGGGYWIVGIDEPIADDALPLRVGQPRVGHRITSDGATYDLSARAAGQRVLLRLTE